MTERRATRYHMKRSDSPLARALGTGFVVFVIVTCIVATVLIGVAVVAGLWKFIGWALA